MVEIFGTVAFSEIVDGRRNMGFRIPAFSKTGARQRAKVNGRIKGIENRSVEKLQKIKSGSLPGQTVYLAVVEGSA